jgi:dipeptidyl-peptidase 4
VEILFIKQVNVTLFFILLFTTPKSQQVTKEDYARAVSFLWSNLNNKTIFNASVDPLWFKDSTGVAYVIHSKGGKSFNKLTWNAKGIFKPYGRYHSL